MMVFDSNGHCRKRIVYDVWEGDYKWKDHTLNKLMTQQPQHYLSNKYNMVHSSSPMHNNTGLKSLVAI